MKKYLIISGLMLVLLAGLFVLERQNPQGGAEMLSRLFHVK